MEPNTLDSNTALFRARSRIGPVWRQGIVLFAVSLVAGFLALEGEIRGTARAGTDTTVQLQIVPGSHSRQIAQQLEESGLVGSALVFDVYTRVRGAGTELKAGNYEVSGHASYLEILGMLRAGAVVTLPLTIPEGLTVPEIAGHLAAHTGDPPDSVLTFLQDTFRVLEFGVPGPTLEGYLFPETYRFAEGIGYRAIAAEMIAMYRAFWSPDRRARADTLGLTEREVVTLASIVEEEAVHDAERQVIAGVYWNRLRIGMPLQADPTVQFALGTRRTRLLYRDIEAVADHPYNTYHRAGLPPGPIASPGEASLLAALAPAEHDYLYFVARTDGSHQFTRTLAQHNRARIEVRRESGASGR